MRSGQGATSFCNVATLSPRDVNAKLDLQPLQLYNVPSRTNGVQGAGRNSKVADLRKRDQLRCVTCAQGAMATGSLAA